MIAALSQFVRLASRAQCQPVCKAAILRLRAARSSGIGKFGNGTNFRAGACGNSRAVRQQRCRKNDGVC